MSRIQLTEQSVDPPTPSQDGGKKTVVVFAKNDGGNTVIKAKDSAGVIADFKGIQGDQGDQGDIGLTGPPGTLAKQIVADIEDPTEIESLTLAVIGADVIAQEEIGAGAPDLSTVYAYDTNGPAKNSPFVMNTGDGGTTRWVALVSSKTNGTVTAADGSRLISSDEQSKISGVEPAATADQTAGEIKTAYESNANTNAFEDADESKLDGIASGATADAPGGAPPDIAGTSDAGSNSTFSRSNHTHGHGVQLGGSQHAVATASMAGFLSASDKSKLDGLTKSTFAYTGGVSAVGSTSQTSSSMGHNNSISGVVMARDGKVIAITISLTVARTAGQCDGMITLNGVLQNAAGQFAIIDAVDTQTALIVLATPIVYNAGDIIELVSNTTSFTPTTSDATLAVLTEDT